MKPEVKCHHVEAGKPCTRYLDGSDGERREIVAWLRSNPVEVALMRTVAALADAIERGDHLKRGRASETPPNGSETKP